MSHELEQKVEHAIELCVVPGRDSSSYWKRDGAPRETAYPCRGWKIVVLRGGGAGDQTRTDKVEMATTVNARQWKA